MRWSRIFSGSIWIQNILLGIIGCGDILKTISSLSDRIIDDKYFSEFTQDWFANISVTKYSSEAVLYFKRTEDYPLTPYLKNNVYGVFTSQDIGHQRCGILEKRRKNCSILGIQCEPQKIFPEGWNDLVESWWMNFQKQVRKIGFDVYKKNQSKITCPRLRTFRRKIRCVLSFQAIYK